jgi:hypothetical protein
VNKTILYISSILHYVLLGYDLRNSCDSSEPIPAKNKPSNADSFSQYRLDRFLSDTTKTTVPFHSTNKNTGYFDIQAAEKDGEKRAENQLKEVDEAFDRASESLKPCGYTNKH